MPEAQVNPVVELCGHHDPVIVDQNREARKVLKLEKDGRDAPGNGNLEELEPICPPFVTVRRTHPHRQGAGKAESTAARSGGLLEPLLHGHPRRGRELVETICRLGRKTLEEIAEIREGVEVETSTGTDQR